MTEGYRRRLICDGCEKTFRWSRNVGEPTEFYFGETGEEPSERCTELRGTSFCRHAVAERRGYLNEQLQGLLKEAGAVLFITVFLPGRELTFPEALKVRPKVEVARLKRLFTKAMKRLPPQGRDAVRAIGAVELCIIDVREDAVRARRVVAVHAHLLVWGMGGKPLRTALKSVVGATAVVQRPLKVTEAPSPAGALAYSLKHRNDHRVTVRDGGTNRFKRRPTKREAAILDRWCSSSPATDAEVLIGLRRTASGIADYREPQ
jgi:hypothetical protein